MWFDNLKIEFSRQVGPNIAESFKIVTKLTLNCGAHMTQPHLPNRPVFLFLMQFEHVCLPTCIIQAWSEDALTLFLRCN